MFSPFHEGLHRVHSFFPSFATKMQQCVCVCVCVCVCDISAQGSPLENQCSRFLLGVGRVDTLCLTCIKIPDSQEKLPGVQHKSHSWHKHSRNSETPLSENSGNTLEIQIYRYQPRSALQADLSKDSILRPAVIIFLCTGVYSSVPFYHKCICL